MTRKIILFKDPISKAIYATPEFNGDKSEFLILLQQSEANSLDGCDKDWKDIITEFFDITTLQEFKQASEKAQSYYHSFLGNEILPIREIDEMPLCDLVYITQGGFTSLLVTLATYPQSPLPKLMIQSIKNDLEADNWLDTHLTEFSLPEHSLKTIVEKSERKWNYEWFMKEWTYDMAEYVYEVALGQGSIVFKRFIEE